jgi:hypothetical protein
MSGRRAPIDRLVDLAVAVPTCTLVAARRAVPLAARIGTLGTAHLIGRVSEAVYERRHHGQVDELFAGAAADVLDVADETSVPAETISTDELPIEGYDDLAARQVVDRLADLDRADLGRIETYEREHRNRSTVLGKISILTA